jgi:hypothetical protein
MIELYRQTGVPRIFILNCIYSRVIVRERQYVKLNIKCLLLALIRAFYIFVVTVYFQPFIATDTHRVLKVFALYTYSASLVFEILFVDCRVPAMFTNREGLA